MGFGSWPPVGIQGTGQDQAVTRLLGDADLGTAVGPEPFTMASPAPRTAVTQGQNHEMNTTKTVLTDHAGGVSKFENLCVG